MGFYKTSLKYPSTYAEVMKVVESILSSTYTCPDKRFRNDKFTSVSFPIGASLFGQIISKSSSRTSLSTPIQDETEWVDFINNNVVLKNCEEKRMKIGNQRSKLVTVPKTGKYNWH